MFGRSKEAYDMARTAQSDARHAQAQIERHEAVCTERWKDAKESMDRLTTAVAGVTHSINEVANSVGRNNGAWTKWVLACAGVLICGMASLLATILLGHHG